MNILVRNVKLVHNIEIMLITKIFGIIVSNSKVALLGKHTLKQ